MEVNFIKDLRHNYLVIPEEDRSNDEAYCIKMLQANSISGILRPDQRIIDNRVLYYYDITSKQSIQIIYEKTAINYNQLKALLKNLAEIIDKTYEYLLNENDLLLDPEYIFTELSTGQIYVCYLTGYNKDLRKQLISLVEYLMNKVDHKDKDAVFFIYNLYSMCRNEDFSYNNLLQAINEDKQENSLIKKDIRNKEEPEQMNIPETAIEDQNPIKQIPVMMEKISDDQEQYYYPMKTYIYTGLCGFSVILILFISFKTKLIYTSLGSRIDYSKLLVLLLMLFSVSGYVMKKIWDKTNRLTRIISRSKYIDPRDEVTDLKVNFNIPNKQENRLSGIKSMSLRNHHKETSGQLAIQKVHRKEANNIYRKLSNDKNILNEINNEISSKINNEMNNEITNNDISNDINPTVLLNVHNPTAMCYLEPEEKDVYEVININNFPFIIGKQKGYVDYCLDKEVVSRYHVKISKDVSGYYITDLNSTNGTCLNKRPLSCYQRFELKDKDEVVIAGIKYIFYEKGMEE